MRIMVQTSYCAFSHSYQENFLATIYCGCLKLQEKK
uniref:Uncharacterized protein n=1 Tax=Rhizophora mucronata TaxID=61149 RepID=A0A2P2Q2R5_RHIMU